MVEWAAMVMGGFAAVLAGETLRRAVVGGRWQRELSSLRAAKPPRPTGA